MRKPDQLFIDRSVVVSSYRVLAQPTPLVLVLKVVLLITFDCLRHQTTQTLPICCSLYNNWAIIKARDTRAVIVSRQWRLVCRGPQCHTGACNLLTSRLIALMTSYCTLWGKKLHRFIFANALTKRFPVIWLLAHIYSNKCGTKRHQNSISLEAYHDTA